MRHFVILLLFDFCAPAMASTWVPVEKSERYTYSVDRDSVRRVGGMVKAWVLASYAEEQKGVNPPYMPYQSAKDLYYFNCDAQQYSIVQETSYTGPFGTGQVVDTDARAFDPKYLRDVVPETINEAILQFACKMAATAKK
jgi:hypothetical protein